MPAKSTSRDDLTELKSVIEAALMASDVPLSVRKIRNMFDEAERPETNQVNRALAAIEKDCDSRGIELRQIGKGYRFQTKDQYSGWLRKLRDTRPPRYSRALIETLSIIAYRQPVTRGDIEGIRGVAVSSDIMRLLLDREWITQIGHRDVPGRPALYATSDSFLEYFNLRSLSDLPALMEPRDVSDVAKDLNITLPMEQPQLKSLADVLDDDDFDDDLDDEELLDAQSDADSDSSDVDDNTTERNDTTRVASDERLSDDEASDDGGVDEFGDRRENDDSENSSGDSKIVSLESALSGADHDTPSETGDEVASHDSDDANDAAGGAAPGQSDQPTGAALRVVADVADPKDTAVVDFSDLDALPSDDEDDTEQTPIQVINTRKGTDVDSPVPSESEPESDASDEDRVDTPTDSSPDDSL